MGWIYFAQAGRDGHIKIGHTHMADPRGRITQLQQMSPEKLVLLGAIRGTVKEERAIQHALRAHHVGREWFRPTAEVREWAASCPSREKLTALTGTDPPLAVTSINIGRRIRRIRESKGMSAQQLAKLAKVDAGNLSKVERGLRAGLSWKSLGRIREVLDVSMDDLLGAGTEDSR